MPTLAALLLATLAPVPVNLDGISIERARHLHGRLVVASFISVKPFDLHRDRQGRDWTIIGAADRDDDAERGAVLRGRRFDLDGGERVKVVGVLEVFDHPPAVVGTLLVPAWVEVRVGE
jgi:hypothetical protein